MIDPRGDNGNGADSGLVETPESQSAAPAEAPAEGAPEKGPGPQAADTQARSQG